MPQDKRRSISYRSFVTCDDPKGVFECGAIRKTKIISPQKREQNPSLAVIKEEKKEMGIGGITREELEVSKGAKRLNHVINSWSNNKPKEHQKEIAQDLLKGALDLQESLIILRKLQEASSYAPPRLTRKEKQKLEEGRFDGMVKGLMDHEKLEMGFQRPRFSVDGSSRKSFDEMRNVVRDSLLRQTLITNPIFEQHFDHRKMGSPDFPSTSSSQSSMIRSSNFVPSDSSISSSTTSQRKNGKGSNLIVRLMGLESLPSSPRKHKEVDRFVNLAKPMYDIDSPRAMGTKQKTVDEILETLNFKGLLRSNSGNGVMPSEVYERPPIVLMKPMHFPCLELDRGVDCVTAGIKEKVMEPRSRRATMEKVASSKAKSSSVNLHQKQQKKEGNVRKVSEVVKVTPTRRKVEEKKVVKPSHELRSRDQSKSSTSKVKKPKNGMLISKNQNSSPRKTTSTAILDHRTWQGVKTRPPVLTGKSQRHKDESKERVPAFKEEIDSISENDSLLPRADCMIADNFHSEKQAEASQIQITDYDDQSSVSDTNETIAYLRNDKNNSIHDVGLIRTYEDDVTSVSITERCNEVTLITTHENGVAVHLNTVDIAPLSIQFEDSMESSIEPDFETCRKSIDPRKKLKGLLLRSPSFVTHAEDLFGLQVNISDETDEDPDDDVATNKLLLDCANEVMQLRSLQFSQTCLPLSRMYTVTNPRSLSIDQLLEEICDGIGDLRCYLRPDDEHFSSDNLYLLLDQDLKFKSGTWEIGWKSAFSQEEAEKVICDIDKVVLGKLIEEVLVDFML